MRASSRRDMSTTRSEAAPAQSSLPMLGPITHVALTVRDIDVSAPWYAALIGSDPVLDEDTGPFRHVVFAVGGTLLGLHQFPEGVTGGPFHEGRAGAGPRALPLAPRGAVG